MWIARAVVTVVVAGSAVAGSAVVGSAVVGPAVAGSTGPVVGSDIAAVRTNHGSPQGTNFTVVLPHESDHFPGARGGLANATHLLTAEGAFDRRDIEDGFDNVSELQFRNPAFNVSACSTDNISLIGVDRDDDDPGTLVDLDLAPYVDPDQTRFRNGSVVFGFYGRTDFERPFEPFRGGREEGRSDGDGTLELYADDQIVLVQGHPVEAGPCYRMPEESDWYQLHSAINGTTFEDRAVDLGNISSHYFYVCPCNSRAAARATIGTAPSGPVGNGTETPTPTSTTPISPTESPTGTPGVTPTETVLSPTTDTGVTATRTNTGGNGDVDGGGSGELTPVLTDGVASGFGLLGTVVGLLVAALSVARRLGT